MRPAVAALLSCFCAATAVAETPPGAVRVQNRLLQKPGRLFVVAGGTMLERADHYQSPGAALSASYYLGEDDALELRGAWFFSALTPAAKDVFERTGLVPDAHRPVALLLGGWRHSLGY